MATATLAHQTPDQFRERVKQQFPDPVLPEPQLAQWRGIEALEILRCRGQEIPMILGRHQKPSAQTPLAKKIDELARSNDECRKEKIQLGILSNRQWHQHRP